MAVSDHNTLIRAAAVVLIVVGASQASAAPGFISGSKVKKGAVYTEVTIDLRCKVQYLGHEPAGQTDILRVRIEPTTVCAGASPGIAATRQMHRPPNADDAHLESIEYDGESAGAESLRFDFTEDVRFDVRAGSRGDSIIVRVFDAPSGQAAAAETEPRHSRLIRRDAATLPDYVINLESSQRRPTSADVPVLELEDDQRLFVSEVEVEGRTWYRIRVGYFADSATAARALKQLRERFPGAWIDRADKDTETPAAIAEAIPEKPTTDVVSDEQQKVAAGSPAAQPDDEIAALMDDARRAMTAGELSRAIQIYTKVLQLPANGHQQQAQEYLALARERNGQVAHARAEYERYLDVYPDSEGAPRVRQRLAALIAVPQHEAASSSVAGAGGSARRRQSDWKLRTFLSQYYRRDVNQLNDQQEIVSQSSLYTDASIDARRRGERFDFSARITAGYRNDLLSESEGGAGNDFRLSYAYADLIDARTGLRGRLGRQTRNSGGVLGRFDGFNLGYDLGERVGFEAVAGRPVYSTSNSDSLDRTFYGVSANYAPSGDNFDIGIFYLTQELDGLTDREAVGAELRYFGETRTVWGMLEYDPVFSEIGSGFLQVSWRLPGEFTVSGIVDHRYSPYLTLGNALVGQTSQRFEDLRLAFTDDELRQLALDRSAATTTVTFGVSRALTPRLQLGLNATRSAVDATEASAGVQAVPESEYSYYSVDLVASSLLREGDVGIFSLRQSSTSTSETLSLSIDARFPLSRSWRLSPRLRVDRRENSSDRSEEMIYTPGLRLQYRMGRHARFDLEAGREYSSRDMLDTMPDMDRESYFVNFGYQLFF